MLLLPLLLTDDSHYSNKTHDTPISMTAPFASAFQNLVEKGKQTAVSSVTV